MRQGQYNSLHWNCWPSIYSHLHLYRKKTCQIPAQCNTPVVPMPVNISIRQPEVFFQTTPLGHLERHRNMLTPDEWFKRERRNSDILWYVSIKYISLLSISSTSVAFFYNVFLRQSQIQSSASSPRAPGGGECIIYYWLPQSTFPPQGPPTQLHQSPSSVSECNDTTARQTSTRIWSNATQS